MKRRDFLAAAGFGPYSVMVFADQLPPREAPLPVGDRVRRELEKVAPPSAERGQIAHEPHMRLVELECDVLVAGGGMAGVCAAVAAARHGSRVVLVQDRSRLGGNSSSEVKMHISGSARLSGWRESGLLEEFELDDVVNNPQGSFELWDLLLYDKVVSEPNITLLLDTSICGARMQGNRITEAMARSEATEHVYHIRAKIFCDCTGDSRLGLEAGAILRGGREARSEFNEPLALAKADDATLGSSLLFTSRDYGRPMPFKPPAWARKVTRNHLRLRPITEWDYGYWWIEWGGDRDVIGDQERIRFELLSIVMGVWDYIKNSGDHPSSANWAMDWVGFLPAKRGSRRMEGDYILTQHDIERGDIEDGVAIGGWPMDDHPPAGFDRPHLRPNVNGPVKVPYNIPLRSLYSKNIENLMMAGRNISCSHVAFTSTRVMGTCSVVGQAAGTAAALCVQRGVAPRGVYQDKALLGELQQTLLRDDQTIRNRVNTDPRDLARQAAVKCSGETGEARAALVIDGHLRDYPNPEKGKPKEIHHWEAPLGDGGAWIELSWPAPRRIREIQITFDTGFHRFLRLSGSKRVRDATIRAPQPETVRDYKVLCRAPGGGLTELLSVEGNYQRVNRHLVEPVEAEAVRIHVLATNGDPAARIFEVRCYG